MSLCHFTWDWAKCLIPPLSPPSDTEIWCETRICYPRLGDLAKEVVSPEPTIFPSSQACAWLQWLLVFCETSPLVCFSGNKGCFLSFFLESEAGVFPSNSKVSYVVNCQLPRFSGFTVHRNHLERLLGTDSPWECPGRKSTPTTTKTCLRELEVSQAGVLGPVFEKHCSKGQRDFLNGIAVQVFTPKRTEL